MSRLALHAVLGGVMSVGLAACTTTGTDTISPTAGNAVRHNQVVHTIDPWPPEAWRVKIGSAGIRARRAVDQLEGAGASGQGTQAQAPQSMAEPESAPPQP